MMSEQEIRPIISCHHADTPGESYHWDYSTQAGAICPYCKSIEPDLFLSIIEDDGLISGWHWLNDRPVYCETSFGRFYAIHLLDMPVQWMFDNAMLIFEKTGTHFWWSGELFNHGSVKTNRTYTQETPFVPTGAQMAQREERNLQRYQKQKDLIQ